MKRRRFLLLFSVAAFLTGIAAGQVHADEDPTAKDPKKFIRLLRDDDDRPVALQTSIVRYAGAAGSSPTVDLIGAVHVGEKAYYARLNKAFRRYDAVLYELVAPEENAVPQSDARSGNPVSAMQLGLKNLLGLEYQLDGIDYERPNMVHADLSWEEFAQSMADRDEGIIQMFFRALGHGAAMQSKDPGRSSDVALLAALFSRDRARKLKTVMAQQVDDLLGGATIFDGPDGSTIVTVRNKRAMDVLAEQIRGGKKRIAIFYGAAHLADMERQLLERFRLKRIQEQWVTAWELGPKPTSISQPRKSR